MTRGDWTDETTVAGRATIGDDYYLRQGGYVFIGISWFVCLLAGLCKIKTTRPIFTKFGGKVATKETIRFFSGHPGHVTLRLRLDGGTAIRRLGGYRKCV